MHQLPQRNQLCLNQLTLLCISLQQDVRRSDSKRSPIALDLCIG